MPNGKGALDELGCLFSGKNPDTEEHVIPDWLQRRFALQRQAYHLPNDTALDYRHARVPATDADNRLFGQIEARISRDQFVWEEIYLWLFKVHIGMMYRDVGLRADIRDANSGSIVPASVFYTHLQIFRELCREYFSGGQLNTFRSPPGSVFILPSMGPGYFDFVHSFTCGCVAVNTGDFFLAASLWDFGMAKDFGYFDWVWDKGYVADPPPDLNDEQRASFYHHNQAIWLCNLGYWCQRWNINMYRIALDSQPEVPNFEGTPFQRPEDPAELAQICATFGLKLDKFISDGRSIFSLAEGRLRRS